MLVSIQLNSNRPAEILDFIKNVEETSFDPSQIEMIFHIDLCDEKCRKILDEKKITSKIQIKYLETDIIKSYKDLWKPLNELLKLTDPNAYFVTNFSDEFRFKTKGWDDVLKKYIGYYEDDVFRVRLSRYRFRNYKDSWECVFAPDSLAFYTKKWMDIVGMWCPCLGPDSWQQLVAFYLTNSRKFDHIQYNRDVPEPFLQFSGEGASIGLKGLKARQRIKDNVDLWFETVSHEMQEKAKYAAAMLEANIILHDNSYNKNSITHNFVTNRKPPHLCEQDISKITLNNNAEKSRLEFYCNNRSIYQISYQLSKLKLILVNNIRKINYGYYAGGGQECFRKDFISQINVYLRMKKYGVLRPGVNFSSLQISKPKFFKKNKIFAPLWFPIKAVLIFYKVAFSGLLKITKTTKYYRFLKFKTHCYQTFLSKKTYDLPNKIREYCNHKNRFFTILLYVPIKIIEQSSDLRKKYLEAFGRKGLQKPCYLKHKKDGLLWPVIKLSIIISFCFKFYYSKFCDRFNSNI